MLLACSYRGYGLSDGRPTERGLQLDAQAALDYLHTGRADIDRCSLQHTVFTSDRARLQCGLCQTSCARRTSDCGDVCVLASDRDSIAVFGRSLGGAVTIHLAARNAKKVARAARLP